MKKISRREAIGTVMAAGVGVLTSNSNTSAQTEIVPMAFGAKHQPKPLPFDPSKLNGISEKLIRSHHENNYTGAVKALNLVEQHLVAMAKEKDLPAYLYGDLKREELIRTGSVVLHEKYFANLRGNGKADGTAKNSLRNGLAATMCGRRNSNGSAMRFPAVQAGRYSHSIRIQKNFTIIGPQITRATLRSAFRSSCWTCTNMLIKWITVLPPQNMSTRSCPTSTGMR